MGYIVMLIFFITPLMGIILYYYTYREEVKEEFQDLKNQDLLKKVVAQGTPRKFF